MPVSNSASDSPAPASAAAETGWRLRQALWRWHFYAGLLAAPILLILAVSGLVMLLQAPMESALYGHLLRVQPQQGAIQSPSAQLAAARALLPAMEPMLFVPPAAAGRATEITLFPGDAGGHAGHSADTPTISVFVNPYSAQVLGTLDRRHTPYGWANAVHGSLLLGPVGDGLIEIAAGCAVLLVGSGVVLAVRRRGPARAALLPAVKGRLPAAARVTHASIGLWMAFPLLFFLLSGLTWTGVWGGRLVQAWNTVGSERAHDGPVAATHAALNRGSLEEVPWALERAPLPTSGFAAGPTAFEGAPDLDRVVDFAQEAGFGNFRINLPRGADGVWTISASTMAGDTNDPRAERFVHLDRYTGEVLADIRYADYSPLARFMASGVPFHQGALGPVNVAFNAGVCLALIALMTAAIRLWRRRAPQRGSSAPPATDVRAWRCVVGAMVLFALAFPLTAVGLLLLALFDQLLLTRDENP